MYRWSGLLTIVFSVIQPALAQDFPTKPIRVIVGFPPGAGADMTARLAAQKLNEAWGRPVIVDNKPGAGGNLAAELVAKAAPDGYTLILMPGPAAPSLYPKLPYDLRKDFAAITQVGRSPVVLVVHPSVPASNVKELITLARLHPGKLNYASSGIGIPPHLAGELFRKMAKVNIVHVPYKGGGPAVVGVMAGEVDLMFASIPPVLGQIKTHRLKALGTASLQRSSVLPDVPTLTEAGVPGYESYLWWGMLAPAGTPSEVVMKLNATLVRGLNAADVRKRLADEGAEVVANSPAEFGDFFQKEITKWDGLFTVVAKPSL